MWILFLIITYIALGSVIGVIKSGTKGGTFKDFFNAIEEYLEPPKKEAPKIQKEKIKEEPVSVFHETESSWDEDEEDDDIILQVERNISRKNIKDVRALIDRRSLRHGIIVSEILNKPKSLR